jgi:hypothetical protein
LACLDGYMNVALEQTEEYVDGQVCVCVCVCIGVCACVCVCVCVCVCSYNLYCRSVCCISCAPACMHAFIFHALHLFRLLCPLRTSYVFAPALLYSASLSLRAFSHLYCPFSSSKSMAMHLFGETTSCISAHKRGRRERFYFFLSCPFALSFFLPIDDPM